MDRPRFDERVSRCETIGGRPVLSERRVRDLWDELFRVKSDIMKLVARADALRDEIRAEREESHVVEDNRIRSSDSAGAD